MAFKNANLSKVETCYIKVDGVEYSNLTIEHEVVNMLMCMNGMMCLNYQC